jgi:predicted O-linked N-acetylglucosamine transferase (SPINDLY family)
MNLNINEWNCTSKDEYLSKAIDYSKNPDFIQKSKKKIYETVYVKKLFSSDSFFINFKMLVTKLFKKHI